MRKAVRALPVVRTLSGARLRARTGACVLGVATALCVGAATVAAAGGTFSNPAAIPIADSTGAPPHTPGQGSPYPSTLGVSGLPGRVSDVNVTLAGVGHGNPDDLDVLLVGPQGQRIVLLSDAGENVAVAHADLTFDDSASGSAPDTTAITAGSYRPTNHFGGLGEPPDGNDAFPAPAPAGPRAVTLADAFNGTDLNGTWSLYVLDDRPGTTGAFDGGWSLSIQTAEDAPPGPPGPPAGPGPVRAAFAPEGQNAFQRLHRTVTLDASSSLVGDPRAARLLWDVAGDGRPEADCGGEQPELTAHVLGGATSLPVSLTVQSGGITSKLTKTVSLPRRLGGPGPRSASAAQRGGVLGQLNALDRELRQEGKTATLVCERPPSAPTSGDLTENGGPGPGCSTSVSSSILDAIGCLERVNSLVDVPAAERDLLVKTFQTVGELSPGRRVGAAAGPLGKIPPGFGSNPFGRVDPLRAETVSKTADIVAELNPYFSRQPVRINGIDFIPQPGASIVVYPFGDVVASSKALVKVGPATIHSGQLIWRLPDRRRNHLGDFDLPQSLGSAVGGLGIDGRVGLDFGTRTSLLSLNARLPAPITNLGGGPVTGATTLTLDNRQGLDPGGSTLVVDAGRVGGVEIAKSTLNFDKADRAWRGGAPVYVPPSAFVPGELSIRNGALEYLRVRSGPFDAGGGLLFDSLDLQDDQGGGFSLGGGAQTQSGVRLGFFGATCPIFTTAGPARLVGGPFESRVEAKGGATILCIPVPDGRLTARENGLIEVTGTLRSDLIRNVLFVEAPLRGRLQDPHFQANGSARACIQILIKACQGADAVISDAGIGACTNVGLSGPFSFLSVRVGGGIKFRPFETRTFARACDLGPFSSIAAAQAGGQRTLRFGPGLEAAMVEVVGSGGAPSVTLTGPGSRKVVTPPSGRADGKQGYVLDRDSATQTTYILIGRPSGAWKLSADPDSPAIRTVHSAASLPDPSVRAKVTGSGGKRRLAYRIKPISGQRVLFSEIGPSSEKQLGSARGSRGTLRFSSAAGPRGRRRIVATIEQGGFPRSVVTVARYLATPVLPGRPRTVRLRRRGSAVTVRWSRVRGARRYRVVARVSDGRRQAIVVRGTKTTLRGVPPSGRGSVQVVAIDAARQTGRPRSARLRAKTRPRPRPRGTKRPR